MNSDNVIPLDARRRGRRSAPRRSAGAQLYSLPIAPSYPAEADQPAEAEAARAPEHPAPRPPEDDERPWTREELEADRAAHGWDAHPSQYGPEAVTRAQLAEDRRKNAHTWRLRAGLFAPRPPGED